METFGWEMVAIAPKYEHKSEQINQIGLFGLEASTFSPKKALNLPKFWSLIILANAAKSRGNNTQVSTKKSQS